MDLSAYLARLGLDVLPAATADGVASLQSAHRAAIGFENLDVRLGRGIRIDTESVHDKLVSRRRGGYCFEQNRLYAEALRLLGVEARPLLARVRLGMAPGVTPPRTHVCLLLTLEQRPWIADAGFGGSNLPPLPLLHGAKANTSDGARHRLLRVGGSGDLDGEWRLERAGPAQATDGRAADHLDWQVQYTFDLAHVAPDDLEQANHWTSTRPGTRFTTLHVVSIPIEDGFATMTDRELTIYRVSGAERRTIATAAEYATVLRDVFRIELSEDEAARLPLFA